MASDRGFEQALGKHMIDSTLKQHMCEYSMIVVACTCLALSKLCAHLVSRNLVVLWHAVLFDQDKELQCHGGMI